MSYADNHGTRIHYVVEGQGPDLVLIPGFAGTLDDWRDFGYAQSLVKSNRLILIDPRGRGDSDKPHDPGAYAMQHMVRDLVAVLDDLKIEKAHYFGYSMGAVIGFSIPFHAADRFHSLILGGAAYPFAEDDFRDDPLVVAIQQGLEQALAEAPERPMEAFVATLEKALGPYPPDRRARMLAGDARALIATARAMRQIKWPPAAEALPRVNLPCLLFAGEKDTFHAGAERCAALLPDAVFFTLEGLAHLEAYARSDRVLPLVRGFLDRVARHQFLH